MITPTVQTAINKQLNLELFSGYTYLSMAAYFQQDNLNGFGRWMNEQAKEEYGHAMKFYHHLLDRGGKVALEQLATPKQTWGSPLEVFEDAMQHEKNVTSSIYSLLELARKEQDYPLEVLLHWFVTEQVEEEATVESIIEKLKRTNNAPGGIMMLDRELGERVAG